MNQKTCALTGYQSGQILKTMAGRHWHNYDIIIIIITTTTHSLVVNKCPLHNGLLAY